MSAAEPNRTPDPESAPPFPPDDYPTVKGSAFDDDFDQPTLHEPPPAPPTVEPRRSALTNVDPVSIGAGVVFFLIGGAYLLASGGHLSVNAGWTLSLLLLGLGFSGFVGTLISRNRGRRR
jgi:hypothetical protein